MVGLCSSTGIRLAVIGGVLIIALADSLSDALGIHISEEAGGVHSTKLVWEATIVTFLTKFFVSISFVVPILLLDLNLAVVISVIWGLFLISLLSYFIAKDQKAKPLKIIGEHLLIAIFVILASYYMGSWISGWTL